MIVAIKDFYDVKEWKQRELLIEVCAGEKVQKAVENRVAAIEAPATLPAE